MGPVLTIVRVSIDILRVSAMLHHMVKYGTSHLDRTFGALAHPIRRAVLARLARGEASVAELAKPHRVSAPAMTKHLRVLEEAGLMARQKSGRVHHCRLVGSRMKAAEQWLERHRTFWAERLDALDRYLKDHGEGR
jgi:DNA-binding transcriptional ArsR family regulator